MELKMGHTAIACRKCGTITAVENELLESMREHKCPVCNAKMTDYELASMKLKYYFMMALMYERHWGSVKQYEQFDYNIHLWPHYETKDSGRNGNLEGGTEHRKAD